jgi:hypothetical protein
MGFPTVGKNLKIGPKGALFYALIDDAGVVADDFTFAGKANDIPVSWEIAETEIYSSTEGAGEGLLVDTQLNKANMILSPQVQDQRLENLEAFLLGTAAAGDQTAGSVTGTFEYVVLDHYYNLGVRRGTGLVVTDGSTPYVADTDYVYDAESGLLRIKPDGGIAEGDSIDFEITKPILAISRIAMGTNISRFVQVKFQCNDANTGNISAKDTYTFWKARLSPAGPMALVGNGEVAIPLKITVYADTENHPTEPYGVMERAA